MYQQLIDPTTVNRTVTDFGTMTDNDGRPLGSLTSAAVPYPVGVGVTVAAGDVVFLTPPVTGAPGTGYPASVAPLPATPTAAQIAAVVGVALQGAAGPASAAAAVYPSPVIQVCGSVGSVVQVNVEAAVTVAAGDRVVWNGGTTAGKVNKSTVALDATTVVGSLGGIFLTTKVSGKAFMFLNRL